MVAEKSGEKIAVEVKTFLSPSPMLDLERALGQFALYKLAIEIEEPGRALFLALPEAAFELLLADDLGQRLITAQQLRLAVLDPELEVITRWIN